MLPAFLMYCDDVIIIARVKADCKYIAIKSAPIPSFSSFSIFLACVYGKTKGKDNHKDYETEGGRLEYVGSCVSYAAAFVTDRRCRSIQQSHTRFR